MKNNLNQKGIIHILSLVALASIGIVGYLIITNTANFRDRIVSYLNQEKEDAYAATTTPQVGQPVRVDKIPSTSSDYVYTSAIGADNSGRVYIYWTENATYPNEDRALFRVSNDYGKTFTSDPIQIPTPPNSNITSAGSILFPKMCNDDKGNIYLLREYTSNDISDLVRVYINVSSDYGQTWLANDIQLSHPISGVGYHTTYPEISCDENGHVYVVWTDERGSFPNVYFNISSDYGKSWLSQEIRIDPGLDLRTKIINGQTFSNYALGYPKISSDDTGHVFVTWLYKEFTQYTDSHYLKNNIYFNSSSDFGQTWLQPTRVDHAADDITVTYPAIFADNSGHVYLSWLELVSGSGDSSYSVYLNKSQNYGVTWQGSDQKINTQLASLQNIAGRGVYLSGDNSGSVYGLWRGFLSGIGEKPFVNYSQDFSVTWHNDIKIDDHTTSNSGIRVVDLKADKIGKVYSTFEINGDIWFNYSADKGQSWLTSPVQLDSLFANASQYFVGLTNDDKGNVYTTFVNQQAPPYNLYLVPIFISTEAPTITPTPVGTGSTAPTPFPTQTPGSDQTPPQVIIYYPEDGSVWPRSIAMLIRANATDNVGVAKVEFYIEVPPKAAKLVCTDTTIDEYGYTCSWNLPDQRDKTVTIQAKAYDSTGNFSTSTIKIYTSPTSTPMPSAPLLSKRVFVTSSKYSGDLGGLSGADAKCQSKADKVKLGGVWKAWLSDSSTSASSRLSHSENPYIRIDNQIVANNWADLTDGELRNGIGIDESGKLIVTNSFTGAWTGTNSSGNIMTPNCTDWTSRSTRLTGVRGGVGATYFWTVGAYPTQECSNGFYLYCFEQ